jgi:hypothetical protein
MFRLLEFIKYRGETKEKEKTLKKYLSRKACWFTCFEKIILMISFRQSSDVHRIQSLLSSLTQNLLVEE